MTGDADLPYGTPITNLILDDYQGPVFQIKFDHNGTQMIKCTSLFYPLMRLLPPKWEIITRLKKDNKVLLG
jgi:hypothetical protein